MSEETKQTTINAQHIHPDHEESAVIGATTDMRIAALDPDQPHSAVTYAYEEIAGRPVVLLLAVGKQQVDRIRRATECAPSEDEFAVTRIQERHFQEYPDGSQELRPRTDHVSIGDPKDMDYYSALAVQTHAPDLDDDGYGYVVLEQIKLKGIPGCPDAVAQRLDPSHARRIAHLLLKAAAIVEGE